MKKALLTKLMLLLCALIAGSSSVWADNTYTIGWGNATGENSQNFDATNGTATGILSFTCDKNSSSTNPAYNSNNKQLRLYYHNGGDGGSITLTPAAGVTITGATITSAQNPSVNYIVDGGTATSVVSSGGSAPYTYTISGISASSSLKIQNVNTTSTQLQISTIAITYTVSSTPSISFALASKKIGTGCTYTQTPTTANIGANTIYYSSDHTDIASVNSTTGEVTGVAAGTATITASVTVGGTPYSANYSVEVVNVTDGAFDFTNGYDYGSGLEPSNTQNAASTHYTFTAGNVTITTAGTGNFLWNTDLRLYANSSAVIAAPANYNITQIVFTGSGMTAGTIDGVAFANGTSNTWTGKKQSVTIARNTGTVTINTITVTYEAKSDKETATASIDAVKLAVAGGTPTSANITTDPVGLVVSYSSNKTSIATVNDAGVVTPVAAGTVTITASWDEQIVGGTTYEAGSQDFNVSVYQMQDGVFDFECGMFKYGTDMTTTSNNSEYVTEEKTWTSGNVTLVTKGKYRWWDANKTLRFYTADPQTTLTLSAPASNVITKIVITGGNSFTANNGTYSSGTWIGAEQSVTLTYAAESGSVDVKKITVYYSTPTYNITMESEGYMTYCNQNANLSFGDLEAYVISAVGDDNVTLTPITKAPANTPVVLKGTAGEKTLTIEASADAVGDNKLSRSNGTAKNNSYRNVYALAKKGGLVGFYKLKDEVTVPEGKCYISVNKTSAPEFLGFDFNGETTGVNEVRGKMEDVRGKVYNLAGQRVAQPTKGLYIVNGKKVVIK